ncbi:MAG: LysR family transcriptional regulator [Piscinibacter sp.]|nr:LysR family transcriptional regulator [Piscinibacter sp.]
MPLPLVRLTGLDLIRGFVAAGRRMSITLAAQDLCLTQSAISRQIHALELQVGARLFVRGYRSISFTPEGERLFRIADASIQQLQDILGTLTPSRERLPVTITASIGVTALWLLPRLTTLQQQYPDIDVRVAANNKNLDLRTEGVDLALRYCRQSTAPQGAIRLFGEKVVPVAHPSLAVGPLASPSGVTAHVLLEFDDPIRPWLQWGDRLAALGTPPPKPKGILRFNQYDSVIQAAVAGQGIALGRWALVAPMLADGRLVPVEDQPVTVESEHGYWLIQASDEPRADVRTVVDWILAESRQSS